MVRQRIFDAVLLIFAASAIVLACWFELRVGNGRPMSSDLEKFRRRGIGFSSGPVCTPAEGGPPWSSRARGRYRTWRPPGWRRSGAAG